LIINGKNLENVYKVNYLENLGKIHFRIESSTIASAYFFRFLKVYCIGPTLLGQEKTNVHKKIILGQKRVKSLFFSSYCLNSSIFKLCGKGNPNGRSNVEKKILISPENECK